MHPGMTGGLVNALHNIRELLGQGNGCQVVNQSWDLFGKSGTGG